MTILWLDLETFSECDLKAHGTHRYAEHPSTEITVAQWAVDDGEPVVADCTHVGRAPVDHDDIPHALFMLLHSARFDPTITVIAHNSMFDRTLLRHCWGIDVPVERWQDTMIKAMAHGLPGSLDKIGQILGLEADEAKDKRGRDLIHLFCKPRPKGHTLRRATRESHPAEWAEFLEYSRQDIVAMRAIDRKLPSWNYKAGHPELALWHLDQRINDRGFAVDLDLAHAAIDAVAKEQARLKGEVQEATDGLVSSASKRDQLLAFICAEYGVTLPDLKADTLRRRIEDPDLPDGVRLLLSIRLEATKTSTAKYKAAVKATSADGRLRNTLQFAGAQRTARWAGRVFQPQNMSRSTLPQEEIDMGIAALTAGVADLVFTNVMELTANAVRGCIVAPAGKKLCIADLSNIEGRGLAFLAGERWKLKAFAEFDKGVGADLYKLAYARSFNVAPEEVSKQGRQIGKVQELGLGYEGGVAAFLTFAAVYQMDLDELSRAVLATASGEALRNARGMYDWAVKNKRTLGLPADTYVACEILKRAWRDAHPATEALWKAAGDSVRAAIKNPGQTFPIGQHLKARRDGGWLRIRLPSGRYLCYINPDVDETGQISYFGVNQYTRQWGRIKTYGGKLCIAKGSLVLAAKGWTKIEDITRDDLVWDGVEWVRTDGNVCNGVRDVIAAHGAWMTPDHLVLTTEGWKAASQSEGHQRAACRLPDGVEVPREQRAQVTVGAPLRLRRREDHGCERVQEAGQTWSDGLVRLQASGNHRGAEHDARHEQASSLRGVAQHVRPLPTTVASGVAQLRRAWHYGVREVGHVLRQFLGGHGAELLPGTDPGPARQPEGLLPGKLQVGDDGATGQQHADEQNGRRQNGRPARAGAWGQPFNDVLPVGRRGAGGQAGGSPGRVAEVYDLVNCGPRHRFVIWAGGAPLIVHNCENATQAFARDIMAANMPTIEASGYEIILSVHDELLTETPDTDAYSHEHLAEMMATVPPWADGIPLAAAGFETTRYRKD